MTAKLTNLTHLIYASSATHTLHAQDLVAILEKSHQNNARLDVTGMLLYRSGNFLQVLEGDSTVISDLFKVIMQDPRHHQVTHLLTRPVPKRQFENWEMGFTNLDTIDPATIPGYTPFLKEPFHSKRFENANFAYTFLNMFKEGMR